MEKLVVSFMVYVDDNWYGKRYRYYYAGPEGNGFENEAHAKKAASVLKKYVKSRIKDQFGSKGSISGDMEIGDINTMPTYKYLGAGPSWACTNVEVNTERLSMAKQ